MLVKGKTPVVDHSAGQSVTPVAQSTAECEIAIGHMSCDKFGYRHLAWKSIRGKDARHGSHSPWPAKGINSDHRAAVQAGEGMSTDR